LLTTLLQRARAEDPLVAHKWGVQNTILRLGNPLKPLPQISSEPCSENSATETGVFNSKYRLLAYYSRSPTLSKQNSNHWKL